MKKPISKLLTALLVLFTVCLCIFLLVPNDQENKTRTLNPTEKTNLSVDTTTPINTETTLPSTYTLIPSSNTPVFMPTVTLKPEVILPTITQKPIKPTKIPDVVCNCAGPDLDCKDFNNSHKKAQQCYDYCKSQGWGDVFNLDRDNDGSVCEK